MPAQDGSTYRDVLDYLYILDAGVKPGDYYTYAVYGDNAAAASYRDPATMKNVFPAGAPSSAATGIARYQ